MPDYWVRVTHGISMKYKWSHECLHLLFFSSDKEKKTENRSFPNYKTKNKIKSR